MGHFILQYLLGLKDQCWKSLSPMFGMCLHRCPPRRQQQTCPYMPNQVLLITLFQSVPLLCRQFCLNYTFFIFCPKRIKVYVWPPDPFFSKSSINRGGDKNYSRRTVKNRTTLLAVVLKRQFNLDSDYRIHPLLSAEKHADYNKRSFHSQ